MPVDLLSRWHFEALSSCRPVSAAEQPRSSFKRSGTRSAQAKVVFGGLPREPNQGRSMSRDRTFGESSLCELKDSERPCLFCWPNYLKGGKRTALAFRQTSHHSISWRILRQ